MKNNIIRIILALIILAGLSTSLFAARLDIGKDKLVKVNNTIITLKELEDKYNEIAKLYPEGQKPSKKEILSLMINDTLILEVVRNDKSLILNEEQYNQTKNQALGMYIQARRQKDPNYQYNESEFKQYLEKEAGTTYEKFEKDLRERVLIQQYINKRAEPKLQALKNKQYTNSSDFPISIPNQEGGLDKYMSLKDFYDKNPREFIAPKEVELKHIVKFTKTQDQKGNIIDLPKEEKEKQKRIIDDVYKRIKNGESFDELCATYTDDPETRDFKDNNGKYNRGYLFPPVQMSGMATNFYKSRFGEKLFNELFELPKGKISPVMEGAIGYHIFYVINKRDQRLLGFEETKSQIIDFFKSAEYQIILNDASQEILDDLRKKASIVYYNDEYKE